MFNGVKIPLSILLMVISIGAILLFQLHPTNAQPAKHSWSDVQVVSYASGLTGFFDKASGKMYLYDSNLDQPVAIRQLDELGKPMKKIK